MPGKTMSTEQPTLLLANAAAWRRWLALEADTSNGVWLTLAKKVPNHQTSLNYEEALDEALCYGWIDGTGRNLDEATKIRRFTPRRPNSTWSKRNVGYVSRLESEGRMQPRGLLEVAKAKADGRWVAAYSQATIEPSSELVEAIAASPDAQAMWDILTKTNRFLLCMRLASLKTEAGRQKRIAATVDMLARGETPQPQKRKRIAGSPSNHGEEAITVSTSTPESARAERRAKRLHEASRVREP